MMYKGFMFARLVHKKVICISVFYVNIIIIIININFSKTWMKQALQYAGYSLVHDFALTFNFNTDK